MHAQVHIIAIRGIETITVTVKTHIANGLHDMAIYAPSQVKLSWRVVTGDAVQDLLRRAMD